MLHRDSLASQPAHRLAVVCVLWLASPTAVAAQVTLLGGPVAEADMLYLAGQPEQAYETLRTHLAVDSTDYDALWRAARAGVVIGIAEEGSRNQNRWLDPARMYADRAVSVRPDGLDGVYWRGVASGRRAMNAKPSYAVDLAQVVYDDAHTILAADSLHGGAHNMLGKLNYEVMSLSRIKRAVARAFMGNRALSDASWEAAEHHLRRAVETWPDLVLFHFDLAQLHRKRGRREEAIAEFRRALELPPVHPTDQKLHRQASEILREWSVDAAAVMAPADSTATGLDAPRGR